MTALIFASLRRPRRVMVGIINFFALLLLLLLKLSVDAEDQLGSTLAYLMMGLFFSVCRALWMPYGNNLCAGYSTLPSHYI